jgi:hypothetical protein
MLRPGSVWDHQWEEIQRYADPARAIFWEPRTGKTLTVAWQLALLHQAVGPIKILVVGPRAAALTWRDTLGSVGISVADLSRGSVADRIKRIVETQVSALFVNFDVVYAMREHLLAWRPYAVVCDESHHIKTAGSRRSRAMHRIGDRAGWKRILSGTPDPKDFIDVYSQYRFLDSSIFGTNVGMFRSRYVNVHPRYPSKVMSYRNVDELRDKLFSVASRKRRRDCLSMPNETFERRNLELPKWLLAQYRQVGRGEAPLKALLQKQQFLSSHKVQPVLWEIEPWLAANRKVVVYSRFREEQFQIAQAIRRHYPGVPVLEFHGDSSPREREGVQRLFAPGREEGAAVCVCSIAMGESVSFAAADCDVTTSPDFDAMHYEQSRARIWKENGRVHHVDIAYYNTVDQYILTNLQKKRSISAQLLDGDNYDPGR